MDIDLEIKNYRCFTDQNPLRLRFRDGFTALIGRNNTGKSSVLRFLAEFRPVLQNLGSSGAGTLLNQAMAPQSFPIGTLPFLLDQDEIFTNLNDRDISFKLSLISNVTGIVDTIVVTVNRARVVEVKLLAGNKSAMGTDFEGGLSRNGSTLYWGNEVVGDLSPLAEALSALAGAMYVGPFRNAINIGAKQNYYDISVGEAFIKRWAEMQSGTIEAENEATYQVAQDIKDIFNFNSLAINAAPDFSTLQIFLNGRSYKLHELGGGLAQFIVVLGNAAVRKPTMMLIDEPELNLHPLLQLGFLTALAAYTTSGNVVFATHSIGLARSAAIAIIAFQRKDDGSCIAADIEALPRLAEFLGELGYSGYSDLGCCTILLVEGPNDVLTIQQFLRKLRKDQRVVALPLGGGSLIHGRSEDQLLEISRISRDIHALIDSERDAEDAPIPDERADFKSRCEAAGIRCHILGRRAIENYFTTNAVVRAKSKKYQALTNFQKLETSPLPWSKTDNWRIAREMSETDIEGTDDLFDFLNTL